MLNKIDFHNSSIKDINKEKVMEKIEENDIDYIKTLCTNDYDFSFSNNLPIRIASSLGLLEIVKLLLKQDSVNPASFDNFSIRRSVINNHIEVFRLLKSDKRVELFGYQDEILKDACKNGSLEIVKEIILELKKQKEKVKVSYTPAFMAAKGNHLNVLEYLKKENLIKLENKKLEILYNGLNDNFFEVIEFFIHNDLINLTTLNKDVLSKEVLSKLVDKRNKKAIEFLIEKGAYFEDVREILINEILREDLCCEMLILILKLKTKYKIDDLDYIFKIFDINDKDFIKIKDFILFLLKDEYYCDMIIDNIKIKEIKVKKEISDKLYNF